MTFHSRKITDLLPADFWTISEQDQLHALAVAIVASEGATVVHDVLLEALFEIRTGQPVRPTMSVLRKRWRAERKGVRPSPPA